MRSVVTLLLVMIAFGGWGARAEDARTATLYKDPQCHCCAGYAEYLEQNGFEVIVKSTQEISAIKRVAGVPPELQSCHTAIIDGYVVEGHVPIDAVTRLLAERPAIRGISLPGMLQGSPGMSGEKEEPFTIYEIGGGPPKVYAVE